MTRVLCVSGAAGAAFAAAAVDAGRIGPGRRVLLVANEADVPEVAGDPRDVPGFDALTDRFDDVVSWNEIIAPLHPAAWRPPAPEIPVLSRLLGARLGLDGTADELFVESLVQGSGRSLVALLPDVPITVLGLDTAVYGPTLLEPSTDVIERVVRVLHLDLLPGAHPHLLDQAGVPTEAVPPAQYVAALEPLRDPAATGAVVLGERWAQRAVLTADAEREMQLDAVSALVAAGHRDIVFAPHPTAAPDDHRALIAAARDAGATLTIGPAGRPHEAWLGAAPVVGAAATVLFLAPDGVAFASRQLVEGLRRYDHPERVALATADVALPHLDAEGRITPSDPPDLALLVDALSYWLRPTGTPDLRDRTTDWVQQHGPLPYLGRKRLEALGLPTQARPATSRGSIARGLLRRRRRADS